MFKLLEAEGKIFSIIGQLNLTPALEGAGVRSTS
jgi:hypothetical protein